MTANLIFGAKVHNNSGDSVGKVVQLVVVPSQLRVTHLITGKTLKANGRIIPISALNDSAGDELRLSLSPSQTNTLPFDMHQESVQKVSPKKYEGPLGMSGPGDLSTMTTIAQPGDAGMLEHPLTGDAVAGYQPLVDENSVRLSAETEVTGPDGHKVGKLRGFTAEKGSIEYVLVSSGFLSRTQTQISKEQVEGVSTRKIHLSGMH